MRSLILCLVPIVLPAAAHAQYGGYGYGPGGVLGRQGGTLYGASKVIGSQGQVIIQQEQARVEREKANQAKLDTKRQAFDEMMYEKANTPSWSEEQQKVKANTLRRIMIDSSPAEIARGATLNFMMPYLKMLSEQGVPGPPQSLSPSVLKSLNVTTGTDVAGMGMLLNGGRLSWPIALQGPTQKKLAPQIVEAVSQTAKGELDAALYTRVTSGITNLQSELSKKYQTEQIDGSGYLTGKHFLDALEPSVRALQKPDAPKYFDGTFSARGQNVQELVDNMMGEGLQFAPANPGSEFAYRSLHNAFVSYARAGQSSGGYQSNLAAPQPPPQRKY